MSLRARMRPVVALLLIIPAAMTAASAQRSAAGSRAPAGVQQTPGDTIFACFNRFTGAMSLMQPSRGANDCHPKSERRLIVGMIGPDRRAIGLSAFRGRFRAITAASAYQEALPQLEMIVMNAALESANALPVAVGVPIPLEVRFPGEAQTVTTIVMRDIDLDLRLKGVLFADTNRLLDNARERLPVFDFTATTSALNLGSTLGFRAIDSVPGYIGRLTGGLPVSTVIIPEVVVANWKVYADDGVTEVAGDQYRIGSTSPTGFSALIIPPIEELTTSLPATIHYRLRATVQLRIGPDCADPETTTCTDQTELLARREQCDGFADAPFASLRTFCDVDPGDKVAALGSRQLLKEAPRVRIGLSTPALFSSLQRRRLMSDHLLAGLRGATLIAKRSASSRFTRLSIQPKQSASRTKSSYDSDFTPVCTPRAWNSRTICSRPRLRGACPITRRPSRRATAFSQA